MESPKVNTKTERKKYHPLITYLDTFKSQIKTVMFLVPSYSTTFCIFLTLTNTINKTKLNYYLQIINATF